MNYPYMPKSTALWLIENTALTFEQIGEFCGLHELEVKMQANENTIFSLQSYIDSKANENQYGNLLKECMELQQKINEELLKRYK